ncbi:MAG: NAD(P)-dependent glycerol-3-phosphate dehydrogenase [Coriobacteriales bacterium]|jgi:glycerol-3-phosphate dehydrogenase (NAD(P)+)|nr:NAD(P)-dependent glycerol-3-phosphate dehydrogenase [Coriobacteriales bacterium]
MRVAVIGAGSWGSAVARLLAGTGHSVMLWARNAQLVAHINATRQNPHYLPDIELGEGVAATDQMPVALQRAQAVVLATPSQAVRATCAAMASAYPPGVPLLLLSKGLENASGLLLLDVIAKVLATDQGSGSSEGKAATPRESELLATAQGDKMPISAPSGVFAHAASVGVRVREFEPSGVSAGQAETYGSLKEQTPVVAERPVPLAVLSGPNHAEEVAREMLSATVIASQATAVAGFFQSLLGTDFFRIYTSTDTVGVQLCGAAKNVIAIASGLASGLGLGDNTAAMLMTRGLAEIARLVVACGGKGQTCMGLAGMGDLIATCTSQHSRNRAFGLALAAGAHYQDYERQNKMVVEGALACQSITRLACAHQVDMPICETMRGVIWEGQPLQEIIPALMRRSAKPEFY